MRNRFLILLFSSLTLLLTGNVLAAAKLDPANVNASTMTAQHKHFFPAPKSLTTQANNDPQYYISNVSANASCLVTIVDNANDGSPTPFLTTFSLPKGAAYPVDFSVVQSHSVIVYPPCGKGGFIGPVVQAQEMTTTQNQHCQINDNYGLACETV